MRRARRQPERPTSRLFEPFSLFLLIAVKDSIQVTVNSHPNAGTGWNSHDGHRVAGGYKAEQLSLSVSGKFNGVGLVVVRGRLVHQAMHRAIQGALYNHVCRAGGRLAL